MNEALRANVPVNLTNLESVKQQTHNQLPLQRKRRLHLDQTLAELDSKIAGLKKQALFTKIVELEV